MSGYAKLFSSITESSLWSEPKEVRLLFVSMLARADADGFVEASVPGLARMANLTDAEVEIALEVLEGPDRHSKNPEYEGRRLARVPGGWTLLNYETYRNRRSDEDRREYLKNYMREYRRKHQSLRSVNGKQSVNTVNRRKPRLTQAEAEAEAEAEERESASPQSAGADARSFSDLVSHWNSIPGVAHCRSETPSRQAAFRARMKSREWRDGLSEALTEVAASSFLRGESERGWRASIDWFLRPNSLAKILEGAYRDKQATEPESRYQPIPLRTGEHS